MAFGHFKCISRVVFCHISGTICNSRTGLSCQRVKKNAVTQLLGNANLKPTEFLRLTVLANPIAVCAQEKKFWVSLSLVTGIHGFRLESSFFFKLSKPKQTGDVLPSTCVVN